MIAMDEKGDSDEADGGAGTVWRAVLVMKKFRAARLFALGDMGRICQVMIGVTRLHRRSFLATEKGGVNAGGWVAQYGVR